jgi:hypothetical protein
MELQTLMEQLSRIEAEQQRLLVIQTGGMAPGMVGGMMLGAGPCGVAMMPGAAPGGIQPQPHLNSCPRLACLVPDPGTDF